MKVSEDILNYFMLSLFILEQNSSSLFNINETNHRRLVSIAPYQKQYSRMDSTLQLNNY